MRERVKVWGVGEVGAWGRARGRFVDVTTGRRNIQLWMWDTTEGNLLASLCDQAKKHGYWITVTYTTSRYGHQLTGVERVQQEQTA